MAQARVAVVAVKDFDYCGQAVTAGDVCLVRPIEAASLTYRTRARFPQDGEAIGVYDRRDLVARPAGVVTRRRSRGPRRRPVKDADDE